MSRERMRERQTIEEKKMTQTDNRQKLIKRMYTFIQTTNWKAPIKWIATLILALASGLLYLMGTDAEAMTLLDTMRYTVEYGPDAILAPMQRLC